MSKQVIQTYNFDEDAVGLGNFICEAFNDNDVIHDDEIIINVLDGESRYAKSASLVRETLSDGSTVVNLVIEFYE